MREAAPAGTAVETAARAEASPAPLLQARGLCFAAAGKRLLGRIDADVRPHRRTVIMGANGAGKSLLLRLLHGLIRPTAGRGPVAGTAPRPRRPPRAGDGVSASGHAAGGRCSPTFALRWRCAGSADRNARTGKRRRWHRPGSPIWRTGPRAFCPEASSSGWRSPGRWPALPGCCSLTSPPQASIPLRPTRSSSRIRTAHGSGVGHRPGHARHRAGPAARRRPALPARRAGRRNRTRAGGARCAPVGSGPGLARGPLYLDAPPRRGCASNRRAMIGAAGRPPR